MNNEYKNIVDVFENEVEYELLNDTDFINILIPMFNELYLNPILDNIFNLSTNTTKYILFIKYDTYIYIKFGVDKLRKSIFLQIFPDYTIYCQYNYIGILTHRLMREFVNHNLSGPENFTQMFVDLNPRLRINEKVNYINDNTDIFIKNISSDDNDYLINTYIKFLTTIIFEILYMNIPDDISFFKRFEFFKEGKYYNIVLARQINKLILNINDKKLLIRYRKPFTFVNIESVVMLNEEVPRDVIDQLILDFLEHIESLQQYTQHIVQEYEVPDDISKVIYSYNIFEEKKDD